MDTALVLRVPEAEAAVSHWRARHDPSAADGMPAHVTLLYPFRRWPDIDADVYEALAFLFAHGQPVEFHFVETRRFPSILWLAPARPEPVVALVRAIRLAFPECLPYAGAHAEIVPHLTVAHAPAGDETVLDRIEKEFLAEARAHFPIQARAEAASLFRNEEGTWREVKRFALGG